MAMKLRTSINYFESTLNLETRFTIRVKVTVTPTCLEV